MTLTRLCLVAAGALFLSGCDIIGPKLAELGYTHDLGDYAVDSLEFVPQVPPYGHGWGEGRYLRVELVSSHRLHKGYPTYWIGTASDQCPIKDDFGIFTLGVLDEHDVEVDGPKNDKRVQKSGDGNYHYQVFVIAAAPVENPRYDIVMDGRDICLQLMGGDHYHIFARSSVIRIPFSSIEKAARAAGDWAVRPKRR